MMAAKALWATLALLRIGWCLFPQISYLHPDEFFQSPEVMAGDILDLQVNPPWEFLSTFPCRTMVFPFFTSGASFWMMKLLTRFSLLTDSVTSYTLLVLPRLCLTLFSFILDYSVYRTARFWAADRWKAMVLLSGSYVTLVFYTRTFNNVIEGLLFALLLLLVSSDEAKTGRVGKPVSGASEHRTLIGVILSAGCFNRPTFLAFALAPVLYWASKNSKPPFSPMKIPMKLLNILPSAASTALLFIAADTIYFTHDSPVDNHSLHLFNQPQHLMSLMSKNIVVTPFNFLRYNFNPQNLAQHGSHPRITHFAVNGVMLFGILHVSAAIAGCKVLKRTFHQSIGSDISVAPTHSFLSESHPILLLFYFMPIVLLSMFPHQEPRFIIPLIIPLVLWSSPEKQAISWKPIIVAFNILGAIMFGCLHQGGLIPGLSHLEQVIHTKGALTNASHHTLLFTHTYMPPKYLLNIKKQETSVEVIDIAGAGEERLCQMLGDSVRNVSKKNSEPTGYRIHNFYVITPGTVKPAVEKCKFLFKNETLLFPHLTMEDPPEISALFSDQWRSQLGLYILQLDIYATDNEEATTHGAA